MTVMFVTAFSLNTFNKWRWNMYELYKIAYISGSFFGILIRELNSIKTHRINIVQTVISIRVL
jgi:hypothetical protein